MRSLAWKLMLYYLPSQRADWDTVLEKQRAAYQSFIEEMIIKPGSEVKSSEPVHDHVSRCNQLSLSALLL